MLCERCNEREASVDLMEITDGKKSTHHYCLQCFAEVQKELGGPAAQLFDGEFPLSKLLSTLLGMKFGTDKNAPDYPKVTCPTCGTTYEEFIKNSRFGCPDCYNVFDLLIGDNIKQLQGADAHKGKKPKYRHGYMLPESEVKIMPAEVPVQDGRTEKIENLKQLLNKAVSEEEYEAAAKYRDMIRELEEGKNE